MILDNIPVARESSRRDLSIGEVKFDVRIDYPSQKTLQSLGSTIRLYIYTPSSRKTYAF